MIVAPGGPVLVDVTRAALFLEQVRVFPGPALAPVDERDIQQGFGHAERAAMITGDQSHGPVGIAGQPRLEEGGIESRDECRDSGVDPGLAGDGLDGPIQRWPIQWWRVHLDGHHAIVAARPPLVQCLAS